MKALTKFVMVSTLAMASIAPSFAATEIDEKDFGPTYGKMVADATVGKPLGAIAVGFGAAAWVVSLPFTYFNGDMMQARKTLIEDPYYAMDRCLGCTPAEDAYFRSRQANNNQVRVVVDGPSEVVINTDQHVIVNKP
ncbi:MULTISPECIES: hypothetical protein [unclassified Moraxella]|uniref:hypothetical protein n=1 Tax=unclassified Moraxella TaxID=2685852 RepID=UPI003AF6EB6C